MKVLMTCAGLNNELRPITDRINKCLIEINGKTILRSNLDWLQKYDIDEVVISTKYNHNQIERELKNYISKFSINLHHLKEMTDTMHVLKNLSYKFENDFIFMHGDNLYNFDLDDFLKFHKNSKKDLTILAHETQKDYKNKSIIKLNSDETKIEKIIPRSQGKFVNKVLATSGFLVAKKINYDIIHKNDKKVFDHFLPKNVDNINFFKSNSVKFFNNIESL